VIDLVAHLALLLHLHVLKHLGLLDVPQLLLLVDVHLRRVKGQALRLRGVGGGSLLLERRVLLHLQIVLLQLWRHYRAAGLFLWSTSGRTSQRSSSKGAPNKKSKEEVVQTLPPASCP
jgi:hypothetical protein